MNERKETISSIDCIVTNEKFPDGKRRDTYRFTVPGREECRVTGIRAAKRVISGRLDPAVRNTLGLDSDSRQPLSEQIQSASSRVCVDSLHSIIAKEPERER